MLYVLDNSPQNIACYEITRVAVLETWYKRLEHADMDRNLKMVQSVLMLVLALPDLTRLLCAHHPLSKN